MTDEVVEQELEDGILVSIETVALVEHSTIDNVVTQWNLGNLPQTRIRIWN